MKTESQQTVSSAGLIGLTAIGGALVGFVLQLLVAFYFGASNETDAYFMAISTSEMLSKLLLGGSITAVFIPLFVERLAHGAKEEAWQLALNVFHLTSAAFIVVTFLLGLFAGPFVHFIAPGFDAATTDLTIKLLRVLLPAFVILFLVELATSMLHSLKQFTVPALLRLIAPSISIVFIMVFVRSIGIYALAVGAVAGAIIQLGILFWGLSRQGLSYRFIFQPNDPSVRRIIRLVYPFILSVLVTQAAGITYRILVSDLPSGSLAALKFAEKITQLLTIIFLTSVTMVIYPTLSAKAAGRDFVGMRETIASSLRLIAFVTVPVIIGVALLREPLVIFLFQRGSFTAEDTALTSIALLYLVLGLTVNGISSVLGHATLALQETRASVAVSIASQAIAISLFVLLVPRLAHAGLALASSLVPLGITLLYYLYLTRFIPRLKLVFWQRTYGQTLLLAAALAVVIMLVKPRAAGLTDSAIFSPLLELLLPTLAGSLVFFGGAYLWRVPEMHEVTNIVRGKFRKYEFRRR